MGQKLVKNASKNPEERAKGVATKWDRLYLNAARGTIKGGRGRGERSLGIWLNTLPILYSRQAIKMASLEELQIRARKAGYVADIHEPDVEYDIPRRLSISLTKDDDQIQRVAIRAGEIADRWGASRFDEVVPLDDFEAIWWSTDGVVESGLNQGFYSLNSLYKALHPGEQVDLDAEKLPIELPSPTGDLRLSLCQASTEYVLLRPWFGSRFISSRRPTIVMRIEGLKAQSKQEISDVLDRVANAIFFQIDLKFGLPMTLARPHPREIRAPRVLSGDSTLRTPKFQYPKEPMALYWYGRLIDGIPLLRFLALYQCVEFFFPVYSELKVQSEVQKVLKDPRFNPLASADVARLVSIIKPNRSSKGFGDERSQLQATIQECINPSKMREFFNDERVIRFYDRSGNNKMPIVPTKIPVASADADLRPQVAERLYNIRCRVVHSKSGYEEAAILLPFSRETMLMKVDIELMQFVAREVLVASGEPIHL